MSKEKNRGNREARKPKKAEPKANASKPSLKGAIGIDPNSGSSPVPRKGN